MPPASSLKPPAQVLLAGVDEAGRGPLAGPVYAAAVILDPARPVPGIRDSKKLTATQRSALAADIRVHALAWAVASASVDEIDTLNILKATHLAMWRALAGLDAAPGQVQVDGHLCPPIDGLPFTCAIEAVVRGDDSVPAIGAASILAKVERDALMCAFDAEFPGYGFAVHKGYPTAAHLAALRAKGPSPVHRRSFGPVRALLPQAARVDGQGS